jgi:hypothetical protein
MPAWTTWVKWNSTIEQTLIDGHHQVAGDATIAEAHKALRHKGQPSLLDVVTLTDKPFLGQCWVLSHAELHQYFGSKQPPRAAIEAGSAAFIAKLEAAQSVAITTYTKGVPTAVLFACKPA